MAIRSAFIWDWISNSVKSQIAIYKTRGHVKNVKRVAIAKIKPGKFYPFGNEKVYLSLHKVGTPFSIQDDDLFDYCCKLETCIKTIYWTTAYLFYLSMFLL